MHSETGRSSIRSLPPFVRVTLRRWTKIYRGVKGLFAPVADLTVRLAVAQTFFQSGIVKLGNWPAALALAEFEYPVDFMAPDTAALVGVAIELIGPFLLALGLFTRPAAFALLVLTVLAQAVYVPTASNLFIIALLTLTLVRGSGALSLDRMFAAGLRQSALPLAARAVELGEWSAARLTPLVLLCWRVWLAAGLLVIAGWLDPAPELALWLPTAAVTGLPLITALALAALLLAGCIVPVAAAMLALAGGAMMVMGMQPDLTPFPLFLFVMLGLRGAGYLSIDRAVDGWLEADVLFDRDYSDIPADWPHVVVVGAGFGGLACVARLKNLPVRVTLIDRRNHHLFQPLLYQVATATLSPADIATPIRSLFRGDGNVRVVMGQVTAIDPAARTLNYGDGHCLKWDRLVLATGAAHSYFGRDEWGAFAPGLKSVEDGVAVRSHILRAFEMAETLEDPERIRRLLTFVIVGGGPTGVELAGAIAELARMSVAREFRAINPAQARVVLVQSGERILPAFAPALSHSATRSLEGLGVEVRTQARVTAITATHVSIGETKRIETETVLWAAGVVASPAAQWLGARADRAGRVEVDPFLRVPDMPNVFAIGDTATCVDNPVPGLAPAAKQGGQYVARLIETELLGKPMPPAFAYRHQGSLATIGRKAAVADFGWFRIGGTAAWWLWGLIHIGFLSGTRNRATVAVNWVWNFFTLQSGARLISEPRTR